MGPIGYENVSRPYSQVPIDFPSNSMRLIVKRAFKQYNGDLTVKIPDYYIIAIANTAVSD